MAFDYEAAKAQYGAQRAREMEQEASSAPTPGAAPAPAPAVPAPPTNFPAPPGKTGPYKAPVAAAPAPRPAAPPGLGDLSGFKTYADWQAANRAQGGGGSNAQVESYLGGLTGKPGAAPQTAAPQAAGANVPAAAPTPQQMQDATAPPGTFPDDNPDAGKANTGDPYLDELRSGKVAGSEDWRRLSNAQLKAWQEYYVGNGKFRNKYGDIVDKPDDVGPNTPPGFNGTGDRMGQGGGGGNGGAGGGGDAGGAGSGGAAGGAGGDINSMMEANLKKMLSGDTSRYNPQAIQSLLASIKQRTEGSASTQVRQAQEEAAGRGMSRSGRTGTNVAAIRRGAANEFTNQYSNVMKAKINADQQDKLDALDRSQKYLDSMRDELYRRDMSAIQRQQFQANLDLAYANISAQRDALASQQQYGKDMLAANYGYQGTFGG